MNNKLKLIHTITSNVLLFFKSLISIHFTSQILLSRNAIVTYFCTLFLVSCVTTETIKIKNDISNETIYLKHWLLDNPISAISLHRFTDADTTCDIVVDNEGSFFYKYNNDTLYIHTYGIDSIQFENIKHKFKTKLVYQEMKNGNADYCDFCSLYKRLGYKFFPPSMLYIVENTAKEDSLSLKSNH